MTDRPRQRRILWVTSSLQPGGAEQNIVAVMPHLVHHGITPMLCTLTHRTDGPLARMFAQTGLRRFDLRARRLIDPRALARLVRLIRREQIDCIHSHDQDGNLLAAVAAVVSRVPLVMSRHVIMESNENFRARLRARLTVAALRRSASVVIAVSDAVRLSLLDAGVSVASIRIVRNGVDARPFQRFSDRRMARRLVGIPDDAAVVLMPAVLRSGKGHEIMIDAARAVAQELPNLIVLFAGEGPLRKKLENAADPETVCFLGHREDIPVLMAASDVVVLPSFHEGLPTVLIEGALAARPVVASAVGGVGEIVDDHATGLLVDPGDNKQLAASLLMLLRDHDVAYAMGQRAHDQALQRFSLERQANELAAVYRSIV